MTKDLKIGEEVRVLSSGKVRVGQIGTVVATKVNTMIGVMTRVHFHPDEEGYYQDYDLTTDLKSNHD